MAERQYKYVYIRSRAYQQLQKHQLENEDISQTIERILESFDEIAGHAQALTQALARTKLFPKAF